MRNVAFNQCQKDVELLKNRVKDMENEVMKFEQNAAEVSNVLSCTMNQLLQYHRDYESMPSKCDLDRSNMRTIQFNLQKRHDLLTDHISLCKSVKERSERVAAITQELADINEYTVQLFQNLAGILSE